MYGEGRNLRYLIGFGLVIVLLFIVIFMIIRGGGQESDVPETKRTLVSFANESNFTVTQTIVGPITAAQTHDEVEINVTNSAATINAIKGCNGNLVDSRSYPMTTDAFSEFLNALDKAKFTEGNTDKELVNDKGYCSTGQRYILKFTKVPTKSNASGLPAAAVPRPTRVTLTLRTACSRPKSLTTPRL